MTVKYSGPSPQDGRHHLHRVGARQQRLDPVVRCGDAAGDHQRRPDATVKNRQPPQPQQEVGARRQLHMWNGLHGGRVDVGLVEAVEQDDAVGAGGVELPGDVAERREEWGNFHGDGDFQRTASTR